MEPWPKEPGVIELPSGRRVRGRSWRQATESPADFSVVLTTSVGNRFGVPRIVSDAGETVSIDWPDYRLPRRTAHARQVLLDALERSGTERVEITCAGGVGRTGTALAMLLVFDGMDPDEAIDYVREHYNAKAAASPAQRAFIRDIGASTN